MKYRSDDPSHHERTLLPQSYILLPWLEQERKVKEIRFKQFHSDLRQVYLWCILCTCRKYLEAGPKPRNGFSLFFNMQIRSSVLLTVRVRERQGKKGMYVYQNTREEEFKGRRKEMFYLTTHSTHFILRLYGIRHMVKYHSDRQRKPTWATLSD